ncbi:MAG: TetR/AcrR family transcriptional regulator [Candidatus Zixiibacteriota bacterium]
MRTTPRFNSPRIKQSPKLPAETRRKQLLHAARVLFVQRGYRATTTEAIARRAGLTKGALYFHFKSKEEIFGELIRQATDQFAATFDSDAVKNLSPGDVLKLLRKIDASRDMPRTRHNLNLRAEAVKLPRVRTLINKAIRRIIDLVADSLSPQFGRTKNQRRQMAMLTFAVYDGLTLSKQMSPDLINIDRQIGLFTALFRHSKKRT